MASLEHRISSLLNNPMDVRYLEVSTPLSAAPDQDQVDSVLLQFLQTAQNLQTLILTGSEPAIIELFFCDAVHDATLTDYSARSHQLHFLKLDGWKNSSLLMQTILPLMSGIRHIELLNCDDLLEMPSNMPLEQLESLRIDGCHNLQSFSKQCVQGWRNLKQLNVSECENIKEVPDELGTLPELKLIHFKDCKNLQKFASLCNPNGPVNLVLAGCGHLQILPPISCQLGAFCIWNTPITSLNVDENAWKLVSVLELAGCEFQVLPESIYGAFAVQAITLDRCKQLRELPDIGIEGFQCLRRLSLKDCYALERLPSPALGNCQALQELSVAGCYKLVEMPEKTIGRLSCLIKLDVSGCKNLRRLPSSIGSCLSLQELKARKCDKLVELPDEIGNLTSLVALDVSGCKELKQLPASIGNALSLKKLFASGCEHLVEPLPDELGKLTLTHLDVSFSSNLEDFISRSTAVLGQDFVLLNSLRCLSVCQLPKLDHDTWKFALGMRGCGDWSGIMSDSLACGKWHSRDNLSHTTLIDNIE